MGDEMFSRWECQQIRGQMDVWDCVDDAEADAEVIEQPKPKPKPKPLHVTDPLLPYTLGGPDLDDGALFGLTVEGVEETEDIEPAETTEPVEAEAEAASDSPTSTTETDGPTVETLDTGELGVVLDDGPATVVLTAEDTIELDLVPTTMTRAEAVTLARALLAIAQE